ncbi:MAG: hypothetical protein FJW30_27200 [Acidobacteria bacterium]|nr:hypothetical protein [Acidobacteriota bacterium]
MRWLATILLLTLPAAATTLEKLSLDEMTAKSTAIVRGRVSFSHVAKVGRVYYTHYSVQVLERFKGAPSGTVVLPGGRIGNSEQTFAGVPSLGNTNELILFLWTSKTGLTHIIGLSQGILQVSKDAAGQTILSREAIRENLVDPRTGRATEDGGIRMTMGDFQGRMRGAIR